MSEVYLGVWCPTCHEDALPMENGRCGWCETQVVDRETRAPLALAPIEEEQVDICKIDGCASTPAGKGGPWKGMCQEHISAEMTRRHAKRLAAKATAKPPKQRPVVNAATNGNGALTSLAAQVDNARHELDNARTKYHSARDALLAAITAEDA